MKTKLFATLSTLFLTNTFAQDYTQLNLPEGAKARLGKGKINEIQYSPDGTRLAVAGSIGVWLYDVATFREPALLTGHTEVVWSLAFSPDGKTLASGTGNADGTIQLWDTSTGQLKQTIARHPDNVNTLCFSPDGQILVSGSSDNKIRL